MKTFSSNILTFFLFIFFSSPLFAVTISPTVVDLNSTQKIVTITFINDTGREINIQSSALIWKQVNGKDTYSPTND